MGSSKHDCSNYPDFFGVVRSTYQSKLAGIYYQNTNNDTYTETLINACSLVQSNAGCRENLDLIILHPTDLRKLVNDNSTKISYLRESNKDGSFSMGANQLVVHTDFGAIPIKQSIYAVPGYGNLVASKSWHLSSSGKPGILDHDGLSVLRVSTDDAYEGRLAFVNCQVGCSAPGWNGLVQF